MAKYRILIKKSVLKDLDVLPKKEVRRMVAAIRSLADDPRPPQAKRLSGREHYRLRQGDYRILYTIQDEVLVVTVIEVGHRKEIYR